MKFLERDERVNHKKQMKIQSIGGKIESILLGDTKAAL